MPPKVVRSPTKEAAKYPDEANDTPSKGYSPEFMMLFQKMQQDRDRQEKNRQDDLIRFEKQRVSL